MSPPQCSDGHHPHSKTVYVTQDVPEIEDLPDLPFVELSVMGDINGCLKFVEYFTKY